MPARVGLTSRRRPWPYDAYIGGIPVMLSPGVDGNLVSQKSKTLDATAPVDYTYSSANPYKERTFEWQELFGGFGQGEAPSTQPRRYDHAIRADTSIDGLWMKGPGFEYHVETINASAGEVRQIVKALHGGVLTVFALCQNGVWRRIADNNWTPSLAFPGGTFGQQAIRFKHRGAAPVDALYVTTNNTNLYKYDGTTWTVAAAAAGPGTGAVQGEARYIERNNDELWVAGDYWVVKVEDDPFTRANYSAVIYVGDQTAKITYLRTLDGVLFIWKEDGVYTVDAAGLDHELFQTLRGKNNANNGKNAAVWIDKAWFTYGDQTFTLDSVGNLAPDGLEQMLENTSEVRGQWVAGAGHNTWFFYELYYAVQNDTTYLVKHGTWVEEGSSQSNPGVAQFANAHHGSLYHWGKKATCAETVAGLHTGGNDRLYVGFLDGTVQWTPLPRNGPNPAEDSNCEFTGLDSYVELPVHHSGFRADNKLWHGITSFGPNLTASEWVEIQYKLDVTNPLAAWTLLTYQGDSKFTLPGMRKEFSDDEAAMPVYGKNISVRVYLVKDPSLSVSPKSQTPVTHGIGIHESIRPSLSLEFTFLCRVASYLALRNGHADRRRGTDIQQQLIDQCAEVGPVIVMLPTGQSEEMTIIDYHDTSVASENRRDYEWAVQIQAIQLRTISHETIFTGLTYDTLEQYTLDQLEAII